MLCEVKASTVEGISFTGQVKAFEGRGRVIASRVIEEGSEAKEIDREVKEEGGRVIPFLLPSSCFEVPGKDIAGESITFTRETKEIEGETAHSGRRGHLCPRVYLALYPHHVRQRRRDGDEGQRL